MLAASDWTDEFFVYEGRKVHYMHLKKAKPEGRLLILPGLGEAAKKYHEYTTALEDLNVDMVVIDHLGQGESDYWELPQHPHQVHMPDFKNYTGPVLELLSQLEQERSLPTHLQGHSMGGHVALKLLADQPQRFTSILLISPMSEPKTKGLPKWLVKLILNFFPEKSWIPGQKPFQPKPKVSYTQSGERLQKHYEFLKSNPDVIRSGATCAWLKAALRSTEALYKQDWSLWDKEALFLLADVDQLVVNERSEAICAQMPRCQSKVIAGAYHSLLMEPEPYYSQVIRRIRNFIKSQLTEKSGFP